MPVRTGLPAAQRHEPQSDTEHQRAPGPPRPRPRSGAAQGHSAPSRGHRHPLPANPTLARRRTRGAERRRGRAVPESAAAATQQRRRGRSTGVTAAAALPARRCHRPSRRRIPRPPHPATRRRPGCRAGEGTAGSRPDPPAALPRRLT